MLALVCALSLHQPDLRQVSVVTLGNSAYYRVESRANVYETGRQREPSLAVRPDGSFLVTWESARQLDGVSGAFLRTFDSLAAPTSPEIRASRSDYPETRPSAIYTGAEPAAIIQVGFRDSSGDGIFLRDRQVNTRYLGSQSDAVSAPIENGGAIVAWSGEVGPNERRIFARILNSKGGPASSEFQVSGVRTGSEVLPSVASNGHRVLVVWQRFSEDGSSEGIQARLFSHDGTPVGPTVAVWPTRALEPSVSACGDDWLLAWNEPVGDGNFRVVGVLLRPDLSHFASFRAPSQTGSQNAAAVSGRSDGSFALAWNLRKGDDIDAYVLVFDTLCRPSGKPIRVSSQVEGIQALAEATGRSRLHYAHDGSITVVWSGDAGLGDPTAAHVTRLIPSRAMSAHDRSAVYSAASETRNNLRPSAPESLRKHNQPIARVTEQAVPHDPPRFNKRQRDPWRNRQEFSDGGGFLAITNTGWTPPDPEMGVGPNHIVCIVNGEIAFFNKNGTNTFRQDIEGAAGFWGALGAGGFVFDPEALYDPHTGRFMAMACERTAGLSYFLLAVSDDADPNGTWYKYRFDVTALAGGDIDSPNMAVDATTVYLTADFFTGGQKYLVYMLRKSDVLTGAAPLTTSMLITGTQSYGLPITWDATAPAQYMIEHFEASSNTTVRLHAIRDSLTAPTRVTYSLTVPTYGPPEDPPQSGTTVRPETFDSRFWSCVYRDGSLWATHHVNASNVRARWYQIAMNGWPTSGNNPTLVQSGEILPASGVRTFFGSISVDSVGNAAVVCARSSPTEFISMYRAVRRATDPLGTMPDQQIVRSSNAAYTTNRWGDYSACVTDPSDGRTFWGHHEYADSGSWRTWVDPFVAGVNTVLLSPSSFSVIAGSLQSGGLSQLSTSDDDRMYIQEAPVISTSDPSVRLEVRATAPVTNILGLQFKIESQCTGLPSNAMTQTIELYNESAAVWEVVDSRAPTYGDGVIIVTPVGDPVRFINPTTKQTRARVSWFGLLVFMPGWRSGIDQAQWTISY